MDGAEAEVVTTSVAIERAVEAGLDLVEIAPTAKPPVAKIMDFKKFLFEQKKKKKEIKSKAQKVVLKEIRFGPNTDEHDFLFKLKHGRKFLEEGAKLKAFRSYAKNGRKENDNFLESQKETVNNKSRDNKC
jgi:translation initiation factor IF-3